MAERCRQILKSFVQSMYDEGILDLQFAQLQALQDASNPSFVTDVIKLFIQDAGKIIMELNGILSERVVNFPGMDSYVHQLKGSSSSIGAQLIKNACNDFRQACDANSREGCIRALNKINNEYQRVRAKFHKIIQLEETILSYSVRGQ
ncbi:histidine-containing phosphotransfer protein 2-like [Macadamia integrifolia]|uniref:histidine-containing phosphotransfer protein 2-like n=1 Tax=Macadamia integrifolia TaxID=60698 RepID=UPI001C52F245|nr:histidine-containing phosphotransfer protein 2-like [Macadamia integrifolia]